MKVEIKLKPHNKDTYKKMQDILKTDNKTCIIQPTGSGKSFLILKLIEDYIAFGEDIIIVEPQKYIFEQLQKKMDKYGLRKDNVKFLTYSALGKLNDEKIQEYNSPKLIVIDEMHRSGAKTWGKGLLKMFETFSNGCKYVGFSATPIRFLDGKRNMAEELFNGCIANEIGLADAILNRILPLPRYIAGLYTYDNEVNAITRKIQSSRNTDEEKEKLLEEVAMMKKNLDKSKGISSIFKKYINQDKGKYVAFCNNISHLKLMRSCLEQWFSEAEISCNFYEVHCKNSEKDKQFNAFMADTGLSVCLSVAMLSEGIHGIDGVILLRGTISPNLYYQQIGRVFSVDMDTVPIIFDLVANCQSIMECNLKNDLLDAIDKRDKDKKSDTNDCDNDKKKITKVEVESFFVFDRVIDAVSQFQNIENKLIIHEWSEEEKTYLKNNYGVASVLELAEKLNRTERSIKCMVNKMNLINLHRQWSKDEIKILKKYYPLEGKKVANRLPYKTEQQCQNKATKMKVKYKGYKGTSKYKYVCLNKYCNKWQVVLNVNGENKYFGMYSSEDEAGKVALQKAKEYGKAI